MNIKNDDLLLSAQVVVKGAIVGISSFCFVLYFLQRMVRTKCMPQVQHAYLSSFNQSN